MPDRSPDSLSPAESLFADWLARRVVGSEAQDLESLCREHPAEAGELRRLWVTWEGLRSVLEKAGFHPDPRSLADKIQQKYGSGVDPNVSIDAGDKADREHQPSSALLKRLAEHTLKTSRYKLHGEIARGGMGAILKVFDEDLRRNLAMKVILGKAEESSTGGTPPVDKRLLTRFLEEAQVTGQLDHPGIVPVHELGLDAEGRVYFTMKLVKGRDLKTIFDLVFEEREGWNETRALGVLLKVCEAMAYAHAKGVIHRDLKPANVMVGDFGEVYVMDWGLARVLGRADTHDLRLQVEGTPLTSIKSERREEREESPDSPLFTMDGDVVGTPAYMSAEQARGEIERLSARSDVYAVGAMIYHLLARHMPYVPYGARVTNRSVLMMVLHGPPPALHTLRPDVPAELAAIAEKAMAREPERRYADTLELARDLRAYLEGRVVRAYEAGAWAEARKWVARNKPLAASLAAAVLLLVGGLAASLTLGARAERNAARADEKAVLADEKAAEADRLRQEAVVREDAATARADALWAIEELKNFNTLDDDLDYARSQDRPTYVWWLEKAHDLVDGRPADPARGMRKKPGLADHRRLLAEIRKAARTPTAAVLAGEVASLKRVVNEPQTLRFTDREKEWWNIQLGPLEQDLEELEQRIPLAERSVLSSEGVQAWNAAIEAIAAHPRYGGLRLTPQLELLPLGPDPASSLWEFAHLGTGVPAVRGTDGRLVLEPETGLVLVLLPSGRVPVEWGRTSTPLNEVQLDPFFLSKYEVTVGQWDRTSRWSGRLDKDVSLLPASAVSWDDCVANLKRAGLFLRLPTEAQWEYGCRAETGISYWTGLRGAANILFDTKDEKHGLQPIGGLLANPFGLHDVYGNVWEWCSDEYGDKSVVVRPGDGERQPTGTRYRVYRGGGFDSQYVGSGKRYGHEPEYSNDALGLRVARRVTP